VFDECVDSSDADFTLNRATWTQDTLALGGVNNVKGWGYYDSPFYWFEVVKTLDSRDGCDWTLHPVDTLGVGNPALDQGPPLRRPLWLQPGQEIREQGNHNLGHRAQGLENPSGGASWSPTRSTTTTWLQ